MKLITSLNLNHDRRSTPRFPWRRAVMVMLLTAMSGGNPVRAAITEYSDSSSFAAAVQPGSFLNDFTGAVSGSSLSYSGGTGPFAYTITSSAGFGVTGVPMNPASGLGISASTFVENATLIITFTGANRPTAIGGNFFWSNLNSPSDVVAGTLHADFKVGGSSVHTLDVLSSGNGAIGFGGVTTDGAGLDSIELSLLGYTSGFFFATVDNFHVGQAVAVPEPGSLVTAGFIGLFVLGRVGWRSLRRQGAGRA